MNQMDIFFIITISSLGIGVIHYIVKRCYQTKCSNITLCWGCLKIERSIQGEIEDHHNDLEHGIRNSFEDDDKYKTSAIVNGVNNS